MPGLVQSADLLDASGNPPVQAATDLVEKHFFHRGYGLEFEMEARWVRSCLPSGRARIADVGCGIGALFDVIGASRVLGVDYSRDGLIHTQRRHPVVPLFCARTESLPFSDRSLDALTLQHVVEHVHQVEQAVREWFRVLRPGGLLVVLTPNVQFCDPTVFEDHSHVRLFDHQDLRNMMQQNGFDILDLRTLGLSWLRQYQHIPSGWRLRRFIMRYACWLSMIPFCRWKGQTLCCAARRPGK